MDPMDVVPRSLEDDAVRHKMELLFKAMVAAVKSPANILDAMEYLSRVHCAILLHNYDPQHWNYLLDSYKKVTIERLNEFMNDPRINPNVARPSDVQ